MKKISSSKIKEIDFWSGNRSEIRQKYEREVLDAILKTTLHEYGKCQVKESKASYSGAEESLAFSQKQHHLLVTVAGNQKFQNDEVIIVARPIAKNLLGYRIPIVVENKQHQLLDAYHHHRLKQQQLGIPETWSDAAIFRYNGYQVAEEGNFDDVFERLNAGNFDYVTFGANEVSSIFQQRAATLNTLIIESSILFFYPFPLVFYVHPNMPQLADRIDKGLQIITDNGELDQIFEAYYAHTVEELQLQKREVIVLENPMLPQILADFDTNLFYTKSL